MRRLRILVVEDDASVSSLLAEILEELGHSVCGIEATEAGSVKAALDAEPDLMIVDVRLGRGGSGLSVVRTISGIAAIPHLFISGDRAQPGQSTANMLQKPFKIRDLVQAIDRTIDAATAGPV